MSVALTYNLVTELVHRLLFLEMSAALLFDLLTSCRWDEAVTLILTRPQTTKCLLNTGKRGAAPISALHVVLAHAKCRGDVPLSLIRLLLEAAPEMAGYPHIYTGNLPLHAVYYNAFFCASKRTEITKLILKVHPSSITTKNNDGRTPLHTNCSQHANHEPMITLLEVAPETASWTDKNGNLPLHLACKSQKSPNASIQALVDAYPQGLHQKNLDGMTPMDLATSSPFRGRKKQARIAFMLKVQQRMINNGYMLEDEPFGMVPCEQFTSQANRKRKRTEDIDSEFVGAAEFSYPSSKRAQWENSTASSHGPTPSLSQYETRQEESQVERLINSDVYDHRAITNDIRDDALTKTVSEILIAMRQGQPCSDNMERE